MKKSHSLLLAASCSLLFACSKKEDATPVATTTTLVAAINGAQQVAPTSSTATGEFSGTYNANTNQLTYTVTYRGLTPTDAHIHTSPSGPGSRGSVSISFASLASPIQGTVTLTPAQATDLLGNKMYINIHTTAFGSGEIRGDIHQ